MNEEDLPDDWLRHVTGSAFVNARPKRLGVAVSGGGDSMACLDLMLWHGRELEFPVEAVTVDHGLRAEAADEIALVADFCAERDVPHSALRWNWDGTGNLQAEARAARYRLMADWARERRVDTIALGHTEDDVAETFLMRLARASGIDGLSAMERRFEREGVIWIRPIIAHGRQVWRTYLRRHGLNWAEDPSNEDDRFDRVKARDVLKALTPLGIDASTLSTVAVNLLVARAALDATVQDVVHRYVAEDRGDLILPTEMPEDDRLPIPGEIMFRLHRYALQWIGGGDYPPRSDAMIALDIAMTAGKTHTLGGCVFTQSTGKTIFDTRWRITREFNAVKHLATPTTALWDGRWALTGPHAPDLEIRALGEAVKDTPWRETGMPRQSLLASPAIWRGETLVAAPVAGFTEGWTAEATGRGKFTDFLISR